MTLFLLLRFTVKARFNEWPNPARFDSLNLRLYA